MSTTTREEPRDELASYFERSASVVQSYAERIEHDYARPAIQTAKDLFREHPLPFTFFCSFGLLSILPILLFIFFSLIITLSLIFLALSSALLASASLVFVLSCLLLFVLATNLCVALFPTIALFWAYALFRLFTLAKANGRAGASQWVEESKAFLASGLGGKIPFEHQKGSPSPSNDSLVLIDQPLEKQGEVEHSDSPPKSED